VQSVADGNIDVAIDSGGGFLVLSEVYYPGWHAQIDGRETALYQTDGALQGIVVPAGTHRVRFVFVSNTFRAGIAGVVLGVLIVGLTLWRTRRQLT
jgi:uncharacterized membrane protein YfhO